MPVPLSRTRISTASPRSRVVTFSTGRIAGPRLARLLVVGGIEAVAEQVEEDARHILRHQLDRRDRGVEIALQRDVEVLVLGAGAVIGEVERLLDQALRSTSRRSPVTPRECSSMLLTMPSARLPCSAIFSRLPVSISTVSSISARSFVAERRQRRRRRLLQLVEQFDRQPGEIVDEIERVLDLVGDPGGQLAERGHLLGLDQIGLRRLQFARAPLSAASRAARISASARLRSVMSL